MKWTSELPKDPGWYFYKCIFTSGRVYINTIIVLRPRKHLYVHKDGRIIKMLLNKFIKLNNVVSWAGPIPEPMEDE